MQGEEQKSKGVWEQFNILSFVAFCPRSPSKTHMLSRNFVAFQNGNFLRVITFFLRK